MSGFTKNVADGTLCQTCGVFIDDAAPGHPRWCDDCRPEGVTHVLDLMEALKRGIAKQTGGDDGRE